MSAARDAIDLPIDPEVPADLRRATALPQLIDTEIEGLSIDSQNWSGKTADGMRITECRLVSVGFDEASLVRCRVRETIVRGGSWANARVSNAALSRVRFEDVRLTGADLSGSSIDNVTFSSCRLDLCSFRLSSIERVRFERCDLKESDLYGATLGHVTFVDCDLSGATLTGATFSHSELLGCDVSGVHSPERLRGVRMPWTDVIGASGELASAVGIEILDRDEVDPGLGRTR